MNKQFIKTYEHAYNFLIECDYTIWEENDRKTCGKNYPSYLGYYKYIIISDDNICCLRTNNKRDVINYANNYIDVLIDERAFETSFYDAVEILETIEYKVDTKLDDDDKVFYDVVDKEGYFIRFYNEFKLIKFAIEKVFKKYFLKKYED